MNRSDDRRDSSTAARATFTSLLPSKRQRTPVLSWFESAILAAYDVSTESWEITLDENFVRLNVGASELITVVRDEIRLLLPRKSDWKALAPHVLWKGEYGGYASMPDCRLVAIAPSFAQELSEVVRDAVRRSAAAGAARRRRTAWAYAHSPGVVTYLSEELRRQLPVAEAVAGPVRVLVASSADYDELAEGSVRKAEWIVPKDAEVGEAAVLFFAGVGFFARATIGSSPRRGAGGRPRAIVAEIEMAGPLSIDAAQEAFPDWRWLTYPRTYTTLGGAAGQRLLRTLRAASSDAFVFFDEGAPVNREHVGFERDRRARAACIARQGHSCQICGFDFDDRYGLKGFVVVHHVKPLGVVRRRHRIRPDEDLIVVCANCHAVIHSRRDAYTPDEVRVMLRKARPERR